MELRSDAVMYRGLCERLSAQLLLAEQTIVAERQEHAERAQEGQVEGVSLGGGRL